MSTFRRHLTAALVFLALTLALTNPLALNLWHSVEDKQDALLNTWIIAWVGHAAITDPLNLYNTNIFYPYPNTLAFSELLIPQGLLALPITLATNNPIFGYNLVLLAMLWLDAFAMYLLLLDWTHDVRAGWVAGAIYSFNPFNLGNLAQTQLLALGWLPLAVLYLARMLRIHADAPRPRVVTQDVFLFALFFILQALSSIYYALFVGLAVGIYLLWWLWTERARITHYSLPFTHYVLRFMLSLLLTAFILIPFLLPYFAVQRELGFERRVGESEPFSASLQQYTQVPPQNVFYGRWLAPNPVKHVGGYPLDSLFPGAVALILAGLGLVRCGAPREKWFLPIVLLGAFVLSLGPRLYLTPQQATEIVLPYRWLYEVFSPLRALRAPVRFDALVNFAVAGLAGLGALAFVTHARAWSALALGAVLLMAGEYLSLPAAHSARLPVASEIPPVYQWLAQQPPGVTLELPLLGADAQGRLDISKQYFSIYHWQKTPDGYSGFVPPRRGEIAYEMQFAPDARAVSLLQALDVRYLVVHLDQFGASAGQMRDALAKTPGLRIARDFGDVVVYAVETPQDIRLQVDKQLYLPQPAQAGAPYVAFLILVNRDDKPFAVKPTDKLNLSASWSDGRVEQLSVPLPLVTSSVSVVPLALHAPARKGRVALGIQGTDQKLGAIDLRAQIAVGDEAAREIVIPAQVVLTRPLEAEYARGGVIPVRVNWMPRNKIDAYYSVSVRVVNEQGAKVVAVDRQPRVPTLLWTPEEEFADEFILRLPDALATGRYRVELLMYDAHDDIGVLLLDKNFAPQTVMALGEFRVE